MPQPEVFALAEGVLDFHFHQNVDRPAIRRAMKPKKRDATTI
jgi:hypothetical protein